MQIVLTWSIRWRRKWIDGDNYTTEKRALALFIRVCRIFVSSLCDELMYYTTMAANLALNSVLLSLIFLAAMFAHSIDSSYYIAKTARTFKWSYWQATHQPISIVQTRRYVAYRVFFLFICRACKATHDHIVHATWVLASTMVGSLFSFCGSSGDLVATMARYLMLVMIMVMGCWVCVLSLATRYHWRRGTAFAQNERATWHVIELKSLTSHFSIS